MFRVKNETLYTQQPAANADAGWSKNSLLFTGKSNKTVETLNSEPIKYQVVAANQVRDFIRNILQSPEIISSIDKPGTILNNLICKLECRPLFHYNANAKSRLIFTSWYGVLATRDTDYVLPAMRDLYLLHELNHIATMPYKIMDNKEWRIEHTKNEKASSFWSEAIVHFEYPSIRANIGLENIWVDRYLNDSIQLVRGLSNHQLYKQSPLVFSALLFNEFTKISIKEYSSLDVHELRTRNYDYMTEVWADAHQVIQTEINQHQVAYFNLIAEGKSEQAINMHMQWLQQNTSENGVLFEEAAIVAKTYFKATKSDPRYATRTLLDNIPNKLGLDGFLHSNVETMLAGIRANNVTLTPLVDPSMRLIQRAGITRTIYAVPLPQGKKITQELWAKNAYDDLYANPHTRRQDAINKQFCAAYAEWCKDMVEGFDGFAFSYPTNGSSEALRESLVSLKAQKPSRKLHVFAAEYEGAANYAQSCALEVITHPTRNLVTLNDQINAAHKDDIFYLSYPSSIDGNVWEKLPEFLNLAQSKGLRVILDIIYIGSYLPVKNSKIQINHPAVECVLFSLSKSFGVYYQRIGGIFCREKNALLEGNLWFKNLFSMQLGMELMRNFSPTHVPTIFAPIQNCLIAYVNAKLNLNLQASDVFLIAQQKISEQKMNSLDPDLQSLSRKAGDEYILRVCLMPLMEYLTSSFASTFKVFDFGIDERVGAQKRPQAKIRQSFL